MKTLASPKKTGKTKWSVRKAHEEDAILIVSCEGEITNALRKAESMGLSIRRPMTYRDLLMGKCRGKSTSRFVIDDAEEMLDYMLKMKIGPDACLVGATMTSSTEETMKASTQRHTTTHE